MDLSDDILIHTVDILLNAEGSVRRLDIVKELMKRKVRTARSQRALKNLLNVHLEKRLEMLQKDLNMVKKTVVSPKNVCYSLKDHKAKEKARKLLNLYSKKAVGNLIEITMEAVFERKKPEEALPFFVLNVQPELIAVIKECCMALMKQNHEDFVFWKKAGEEMLQVYWKSLTNVLQQTPRDKVKEIYATACTMENKINESMSRLVGIKRAR